MSNLRSDCLDLLKSHPPGAMWEAHVKCLVSQIDLIEEYWHEAERKAKQLKDTLESANQSCRSAMSIAEREGEATNWEGFRNTLKESLDLQHRVMYPEQYK